MATFDETRRIAYELCEQGAQFHHDASLPTVTRPLKGVIILRIGVDDVCISASDLIAAEDTARAIKALTTIHEIRQGQSITVDVCTTGTDHRAQCECGSLGDAHND